TAITIHNTQTGIDRAISTNEVGVYSAPFLPPGQYEVTAVKPGFATLVRKNVALQVGQTLTIDLSLSVQATEQTVTVTEEVPIVETEKTESAHVISMSQQENLPLAGRRWENFALLTPNVTNDGSNGLVSYRGISGLYNSSAVDGTNNNQAFFS